MNGGTDDNRIVFFASTDARNKQTPFGIKAKDRTRHVYIIGKTGMGKSTLLENMAIQDIQNGEGMAFVDPHGKTAELLLDYIPENRVKDVLYFAPFDMENPIAFNVMEDIGPDKRHLVVSGLMSAFKKIWIDAWSARMEYILQNTLLALLEYPGSTLLGINKMLSDKVYRKKVVDNIADPTTRAFWVDEFAKYTERFAAEATPAIQNKVGQFTSNPLIRNIIGQPKSTFDFRQMMDEKKIIIINLSKGLVGEGNANLLGSMLITKIYLAAMSRADVPEETMRKLPNFYLYVDEFQSFANESFADILSEARKYKLNLTIAHQYLEQMSEEVRAAVIGNVGTMIAFRVGAFDAEVLEKEFAPQFTAEDMVNLGFAQVYLKLMIDGVSSQPFSAVTMPPIAKPSVSYKQQVIANSRTIFGSPRKSVEEDIEKQLRDQTTLLSAPPSREAGAVPRPSQRPIPQALSPERERELKKLLIPESSVSASRPIAATASPTLSGLRTVLSDAIHEVPIAALSAPQKIFTSPPPKSAPPSFSPPPRREAPTPPISPRLATPIMEKPAPVVRRAEPTPAFKPSNQGKPVSVQAAAAVKTLADRSAGKQGLKDALNKLLAKEKAASQEKTPSGASDNQGPTTEPAPQMPQRPREIPEAELKKILRLPEE